MTGKRYYITTYANWKRHADSFANSHWFVLNQAQATSGSEAGNHRFGSADAILDNDTKILALIEADEGARGNLEDDPQFEPLPHPLSERPISSLAHSALSDHGIKPGASTLDVADVIGRAHPLLRHRVF